MKLNKQTIKKLIKEEFMQEESEEMQPPNRSDVVHIVLYTSDREPEIEGVFSTREKAEAYIEEELQDPRRRAGNYPAGPGRRPRANDFEIGEWRIDHTYT